MTTTSIKMPECQVCGEQAKNEADAQWLHDKAKEDIHPGSQQSATSYVCRPCAEAMSSMAHG